MEISPLLVLFSHSVGYLCALTYGGGQLYTAWGWAWLSGSATFDLHILVYEESSLEKRSESERMGGRGRERRRDSEGGSNVILQHSPSSTLLAYTSERASTHIRSQVVIFHCCLQSTVCHKEVRQVSASCLIFSSLRLQGFFLCWNAVQSICSLHSLDWKYALKPRRLHEIVWKIF